MVDECVAKVIVQELRTAGHDVLYAAEISPNVADTEIVARCRADTRLLLTEDKDFGDLVFRQRLSIPGLVLLRIDAEKNELKWMRLNAAIVHFGSALTRRYTVIEASRFRSRPLLQLV
jgi:predicted nuclease of predicted toxin-antitoxin system